VAKNSNATKTQRHKVQLSRIPGNELKNMQMKQIRLFLLLIFMAIISVAATLVINSSVYEWGKLPVKKTQTGEERTVLSGPTQTLANFDIKAITLSAGKSVNEYKVDIGYDELIIIKEGSAEIIVNEMSKVLGEGSIVVASQGDRVKIRNSKSGNTTFYTFLFKPKAQTVIEKSGVKVLPVLKDWNALEFKANANGGRRDILKQPTSLLMELEMHTTTLNEGLPSHAAHTHPDEEIILVRFGIAEMTISGTSFQAGPGSVFFLSNLDNHGIRNAGKGKCEYYAIRWLTFPIDKK
jgi:mannose-6-phosphate isomerase-like protein (cupin superfamily)